MLRALDKLDNLMVQAVESLSYGWHSTHSLSTTPRFESQTICRYVGKLPVTRNYAVVFMGYSVFLHQLQLSSP